MWSSFSEAASNSRRMSAVASSSQGFEKDWSIALCSRCSPPVLHAANHNSITQVPT
jgi:hypothetical protein